MGTKAVALRRFSKAGATLTALCMVGLVGACAPLLDPTGFKSAMSPTVPSRVDVALSAMARGEYGVAEQSLVTALNADNKDPYALLALGIVYQNTGRPQKAEALYQQILLLNPTGMVSGGPWGNMQMKSIRDVALENLRAMGADDLGASRSGIPGYTAIRDGRSMATGSSPGKRAPEMDLAAETGLGAAGERFGIFKALVEEGLATPEEWAVRRQENLGALLPLSYRAPGVGLDRPPPDVRAIANRLRSLAEAFEARGITARQHAVERQIILDGILPADPDIRATQPPPPKGVLEAATAVGRLERLRAAGVISGDEFEREKSALERVLRGGSPPRPAKAPTKKADEPAKPASAPTQLTPQAAPPGAATAPATPPATAEGAGINNPAAVLQTGRGANMVVPNPTDFNNPDAGTPAGAGGVVAVHLASFKNQEMADKGWKELIGRYPDLAALTPRVTQVTLPDQGQVFRLNAASFPSRATAHEFCAKLKGQYCEVVFLGG